MALYNLSDTNSDCLPDQYQLFLQLLFSWLLSTCWQQKVMLLSVTLLPQFYQVHNVETSNAIATHIAQAASSCFTCLFPGGKQIPHNWHDKSAMLIHCHSRYSVDARCRSYIYVWLRPATDAKEIASLLPCQAMLNRPFSLRDHSEALIFILRSYPETLTQIRLIQILSIILNHHYFIIKKDFYNL